MSEDKLISFILPAYKSRFLKQAVESILNQSYPVFELIIVDDASPENIGEIVSEFNDPRIQYYRNKENIGGESLVKQWNHCLTFANGEYIVMASDDDLYHRDFLSSCLDLTNRYPNVDLIRVGALQINEDNQLIGIDGILPEYSTKYRFVFSWLNAIVFTCIGNYMFKTSAIKQKKFIDFPSAFGSDVVSTINMAENGLASTSESLFSFRISTIHLSSNKEKLREKLQANTLMFDWLGNLNYEVPSSEPDRFFYDRIQWPFLYEKCKYDYYNQVIKFLPFKKAIKWIGDCELLSRKDRNMMLLRYIIKR